MVLKKVFYRAIPLLTILPRVWNLGIGLCIRLSKYLPDQTKKKNQTKTHKILKISKEIGN